MLYVYVKSGGIEQTAGTITKRLYDQSTHAASEPSQQFGHLSWCIGPSPPLQRRGMFIVWRLSSGPGYGCRGGLSSHTGYYSR